MSSFKKKLKDNVIAPYNKYSLSHEKIGEVLEADADRNSCTVMYKNVEGILVTNTNVPCKKGSSKGFLKGFPKKGEYVELQEVGNVVRITGVIDKSNITEEAKETADIYSGATDFGGFLF